MIRHLVKLMWHRKRANALILVEIFFAFLVVFAVATLAVALALNARRPLGFDSSDVWSVAIDVGRESGAGQVGPADQADQADQTDREAAQAETFAQVLAEARRLDRVEQAAGALMVPYVDDSRSEGLTGDPNRGEVSTEIDEVTDGFAEVFRLHLVAGRWFEAADDGFDWMPVVLDRAAAQALFGSADPVGQWLQDDGSGRPRRRVVGVVDAFRQHGELSRPRPYMFERVKVGSGASLPPRTLALRMVPGTSASAEQEIVDRLQAVAPDWTFTVKPVSVLRDENLRFRLLPVSVVAVIAGFMMVMVGLGLMGVLWQNVVQRTREIGLRRANGATRGAIHRQVVAELLLITTAAVVPGVLLLVQLPILELFGEIRSDVFVIGLLTSLATVYLLTAACAFYPSWMAGRVQPAEALHWE